MKALAAKFEQPLFNDDTVSAIATLAYACHHGFSEGEEE
jgi:hypothetical protein